MSEKKIIATLKNVRIKHYDSRNVTVERFEDVFVPIDKKTIRKWVFKGYCKSLLDAMLFIQRNELLINKEDINNLSDYVNQVEESNAILLDVMEK